MEILIKKFKYIGAIHIHTLCSDGSEDIDTISLAAKKAGLDFIIVTDHNNLDTKEGFINGITVIRGEEISPIENNHYLAFDIDAPILPKGSLEESINAVKTAGGFGFAAHPDESDTRNNSYKALPWADKNIHPQGVEIWNWFSQWGDCFDERNIFTIIYTYLFKSNMVKTPYRKTLEWWDNLNKNTDEIVPAIGGMDAHALKISKYLVPVTVFPYSFMFKTLVNQIVLDEPLSEDFETRKKQIFSALKSGKTIIANRLVCDTLPEIFIGNNDGCAFCGDSICLDSNTYMIIKCDKISDVTVFKDGKECIKDTIKDAVFKLYNAGKYRVEIKINGKGFVYSNPIVVTGRVES